MEKFGESDLEKAGECFSLAGLYERAAEVYARGHFISECLSSCMKGKFFDMGLHYIQYWKQLATTNTNMIKISKEIEKVEQEFLENCAHHYHELKDTKTMMKFVKAFHSLESKRNFLTSLDCLDELLLLEEELGNFLEASNIAKLTGEILIEAEMVGKAGNYRDASTLLLCYVFANSLWASGSKGWPLKQFERKEELLTKSRLFAGKESKQFHEFVCTEAIILSNAQTSLFEMNQCLSTSKGNKCVRGEILSARKMIDAHLNSNTTKYEWTDEWVSDLKQYSEGRLSKNFISVETLLYLWNVWKENIVHIFEFLELDDKSQEVKDYSNYEEFCFNYYGVRRQYNNGNLIHALLIPDANWLREVDDRFIRRTGKLVYVDPNQFVSAAQKYWSSELLSVGVQVLENLEVLYGHSTRKPLSLFCQAKLLVHMFEVAEFLLKLKYLDCRYNAAKTLQKFLNISTGEFCSKIFPLDWKKSSTENMVSLRGTELSRNLIKQVISSIISGRNELTYGKIGRTASWILGTGKLTAELYEKIAKRFEVIPPWRAFISNLIGSTGSGFAQGSMPINESQKRVSLVLRLDVALRDTYAAYCGQSDYLSPGYFCYLVDRLLILVSSFQGYCFTTKSSFIEWLTFQEWNTYPNPGLVEDKRFSFGTTFDFIADTAQDILYQKQDTMQWIRNSNINFKEFHPLLVLRLVIMICLICVNVKQAKYFQILFRLLGRGDITSQLPREFCNVLQRRKQNHFSMNESVLAEALRKVDDALVIVKLQRNSLEVSCSDAIFIDMTINQSREDLLQVFFSRNNCPYGVEQLPSSSNAFPDLVSGVHQDLKSQNEEVIEGNPQNNYDHFWDFLNALDCSAIKYLLPNVTRVKVEVENNIRLISLTLDTLGKSPAEGEDINLSQELNSLLDELRQLSSALDTSNNSRRIGDLLIRMKSRKQRVEPLLKQLFLQKDSTTGSEVPVTSAIQNQANEESSQAGESVEADKVNAETPSHSNNGEAESQKGKGKGKVKGKIKKKKKGKGKKN